VSARKGRREGAVTAEPSLEGVGPLISISVQGTSFSRRVRRRSLVDQMDMCIEEK